MKSFFLRRRYQYNRPEGSFTDSVAHLLSLCKGLKSITLFNPVPYDALAGLRPQRLRTSLHHLVGMPTHNIFTLPCFKSITHLELYTSASHTRDLPFDALPSLTHLAFSDHHPDATPILIHILETCPGLQMLLVPPLRDGRSGWYIEDLRLFFRPTQPALSDWLDCTSGDDIWQKARRSAHLP